MNADISNRTDICRCRNGHVFEFSERKSVSSGYTYRYVCPECGSNFTFLQIKNLNDEKYLNKFIHGGVQ